MFRSDRINNVHWVGVGAGLAAAYGAATAVIAPLLFYWTQQQDSVGGPWALSLAFASSGFGRATNLGALAIGVLVGGYAATTYSRSETLETGTAVGVIALGIKGVPALAGLLLHGSGSFTSLAVSILFIPIAYLGAMVGFRRVAVWRRQCDELDPWKTEPRG